MLHIHRSERADALVAPLADVLADPPDDPFTPDVVAVPTRGIERWLAQRLSHRLGTAAEPGAGDGVCANVDFGSPSRLVAAAVTAVTGVDRDDDPWRRSRLVWPVLETIDASLDEPWAAPLARYVGEADDGVRRSRRVALAQRVAELFAAYAQQRPALLTGWLDPGTEAAVPADLAWQPALWRLVRARVDAPGPAEVLADAVETITRDPGTVDLPARLSVFGPTRLPQDQLDVLRALAHHRDVHLWLPHPSPALWDAVAAWSGPGAPPRGPRRDDLPVLARHPLLASTARDAVELQLRLVDDDVVVVHHAAPAPPATLLGRLQTALRTDDPDLPATDLEPADRSVQVHACHGRARQVEVLREVLTGMFAADPTLQPRDVVVLCPDVEAFAPLITATFGAAPDGVPVHPGQHLRVSLADRGAGVVNPVLGVLATLLRLADGRVTASEVLDLAASEPVRRRFRLSDDDLDRWRDWAVEVGVRWGEDGARRARFGIDPRVRQGTWDAALDRVLLGVAMAEEDSRYVGPALPLDDVGSTDVEVAGRFAELVARLTRLLSDLDGSHALTHWLDVLDRAVTWLTDPAPDDAWQTVQARRVLGDVRAAGSGGVHDDGPASDALAGASLRLEDVRALLADRLAGRPTRAGFRTGALTVCSLEPMRAVPHRVVCLLGMQDGAFPRSATPDGDDLLARDARLGERDRRSEDRQIFLDALTAAHERLVVLHSGADERTGAVRPPAVPVAELLDAVDRVGRTADGRPAREQVVVRHPLQVVGERNFVPGSLGTPGPFSFDAAAHRGALAGRAERTTPGLLVTAPLDVSLRGGGGTGHGTAGHGSGGEGSDAAGAPEVDLDELVRLLEHPARWFVRTTLGVTLTGESDEVTDRLPLTMAPLAAWGAGDRILAALLDGTDPDRAFQAEWRRGQAPPRKLGFAALRDVVQRVQPVRATAQQAVSVGEARVVDVAAALPSGVLVTGTVPGVHGRRVVRAEYSRLGPKHRLRAWVQVLALAASEQDPAGGRAGADDDLPAWHAVTVGRAPARGPRAAWSKIDAPSPADARRLLDDLVALRAVAARAPLPLPPEASHAYAVSRGSGTGDPAQALSEARYTWNGGFEKSDPYHLLCWGEGVALDTIAGTPDDDDRRTFGDEPTRLGALARRVWDPLLAHEQKGTS
ncbi:exodeoxyribonuclease V subunit gamma [Isoptericola sp. NEAU-Y5]|uniref:RecBCD enzyme subunit RecC n=1 Tax=Isoptericola luteus TaxID=2879484 RepID=A0ABS7ZE61_9MICO|nr:exodeoxyribonuclease V subunit gamma [Isoptericola sp. NEAU-Y5]MCA5892055.1 exodeoxyribonuclease V subunit gamma [Isoptericola sp. NEAU-Y5]